MKDQIELGPAPHDEEPVQVGEDNYEVRMRTECSVYADQLRRLYMKEHGHQLPAGVDLLVKSFSHDFGRYYEVVIVFHDDDANGIKTAYWFDANCPARWDDEAKLQLRST